jgi:hypothetical protein
MPLTSNMELMLRWTHTSALDLSTVSDVAAYSVIDELASGTGLDQADRIWHDRRTLAAAAEDLDLAGSLTNAFGVTATFAKVKGLLIKNRNTTAGHVLSIGGDAASLALFTAVNDIYPLGPDGVFFIWEPSAAGKAVTAGTGDLLQIDAGANTISYDIIVIGTSA